LEAARRLVTEFRLETGQGRRDLSAGRNLDADSVIAAQNIEPLHSSPFCGARVCALRLSRCCHQGQSQQR